MKEIKFRARDIKTKKWRYRFYVYDQEWAKVWIYYVGRPSDESFYKLLIWEVDEETAESVH